MNDITNDHLSLTRASIADVSEKKWMSEDFIRENQDPETNPFISVPNPKTFAPEGSVNMRPYFFATQPVVRKIIEDTFSKRNSVELFEYISAIVKYHDDVNTVHSKEWVQENIVTQPKKIEEFSSYFIKPLATYYDTDEPAYQISRKMPPISYEAFSAFAKLMMPANQKFECELIYGEVFKSPVYSAGAILNCLNLCRNNRKQEDPFQTREWLWLECGNQYLMSFKTAQDFVNNQASGSNGNGDPMRYEERYTPLIRVSTYILGEIFKELDLTSPEKVASFQQKIGRMMEYSGAAKTLYLLKERLNPELMDSSITKAKLSTHDLNDLLGYAERVKQYPSLTQAEQKLVDALSNGSVITLINDIVRNPKKHNVDVEPMRSTWNVSTKADSVIDSPAFVERLTKGIKSCAERMFTAA